MLTYRVYRLYDIANPSSKHRDEILSHSLHYDSSTINAPAVFAFEHPVQELLLPPCTGPRTTGEEEGKGGRGGEMKYLTSFMVNPLCKNIPVVTDHSFSPNQQSFSRKHPSDFSPFASLPPLCQSEHSVNRLFLSIHTII